MTRPRKPRPVSSPWWRSRDFRRAWWGLEESSENRPLDRVFSDYRRHMKRLELQHALFLVAIALLSCGLLLWVTR